jgi:tripartite-type tricarboxylate transporter receptor subunit TctC
MTRGGAHLRRLLYVAFALAVAAPVGAAQAPYPTRPIRFVVPFPPGGGADIIARALGQKVGEHFGQAIVVDNRAGASGVLGADIAAKAPPDGYSILLASSNLAIIEGAGGSRPYDLRRDLKSITMVAFAPNLLVVNPSVPATSVKQLIAHAKANPGKLHFASNGIGSSSHLSAELFKMLTATDMLHVPYKGGPPGVAATLAGEVQLMFSAILHVLPHTKSGRARPLGVTGKTRSKAAPQIPTIAESGVPGYESSQWWIVMVPAKAPAHVVERLHAAFSSALKAPDLVGRLSSQGAEALESSPAEAARYLDSEIVKWGKIVKASGIKLE